MEKSKVLIFPSAKRDLQEIVDYINQQSSFDDVTLYDELVNSIGLLSQMPMRHPSIKNPLLRAKGYRVLVVRSYLVFYVVIGNVVQIRRILHGKRRYEFLL
ncbi:type II toxin-antitoxin system RelE/ParE family toxin [Paenibacillus thalictri]|uniref:Type II toxin-antitoxin system RelE/ParE family toxin n=1 Tax=Paenibacillus thalictri TaxID=2527873 RepID=A0A4Q9DZM1_9BACL|nr:type II toxin-antitoxin system RelE/ParE family toxin [Paenibacillus thalictri]TBL80731.1 type II toxin-antitoxin system RelE/ParE family toxin [Paenibacillus thalictri]